MAGLTLSLKPAPSARAVACTSPPAPPLNWSPRSPSPRLAGLREVVDEVERRLHGLRLRGLGAGVVEGLAE
eukprot:2809909-Alexandrium_andersonii.AAC.1